MLNHNTIELLLDAPRICETAAPGQFVNVLCGEGNLLRRPISIGNLDRDILTLIVESRGKGSRWLLEQECGTELDLLGPLGKGFRLQAPPERTLLVGGGVGVAPLLYVARKFSGRAGIIAGFRSAPQVILESDFRALSSSFVLTTDDGTAGEGGTVLGPLQRALSSGGYDLVLTCGPRPMMRAVAQCCLAADVSCQVSLEERMGCGVGACLVCACKIRRKDTEEMLHVCVDGPVFDASEVIWDD